MKSFKERLLNVIPGGAHTYSRGHDQFPVNAPQILAKGVGAYVYCPKGKKWLDYGMGLRAVNVGYAEPTINDAAYEAMCLGNNLTKPSLIELDAAEKLVELIPTADMVKFTKNGSTSVTAAIKLARAFTGRTKIIRCSQQPFLSYDDWFISSTVLTRGIPLETSKNILAFDYGDLEGLEALLKSHDNQVAALVIEAATTSHPEPNFLIHLAIMCKQYGVVFILDEMITGFRWDLHGAQNYYGISPDLSTFGKAMANGFSVSCVAGKKEIMSLGGIEDTGLERTFLLSSTHGAEMSSLAAFIATTKFSEENNVVEHIWWYGSKLIKMMNDVAKNLGISEHFWVEGVPCSPNYYTTDRSGENSLVMRTIFAQEMVKNGVLMPWIALSYSHREQELEITQAALKKSLTVYSQALAQGPDKFLIGEPIKPVFRKYN
jgi:glutamate-1-semialdehyde 2,1-aminomutase